MSFPSNYGGVDFSSILEQNSDDEFDDNDCIDMLEHDTIISLRYYNMLGSAMLDYLSRLHQPHPSRFPNIHNGHMFMLDCLEQPSGQICFQEFCMHPLMFTHFSHILRDNYGLQTKNNVDVYEQVAMFLSILAHGKGYRKIQTCFEHSLYTIGRYFRKVLSAVVSLGAHVIKPDPNYNQSPIHHRPDPAKHRMFKDCIGAIYGTHIQGVLPENEKLNFIRRKRYLTQNMLAVHDFNMCFTFVMTGTSGKTHDSYILARAIHDPEIHFPLPAFDKYYLVDSDFAHRRGYMASFKGRMLDIISKSSVLEARHVDVDFGTIMNVLIFTIRLVGTLLKGHLMYSRNVGKFWMPHYPFEIQTAFVVATMIIHNVLRHSGHIDQGFRSAEQVDDAAEIDLSRQDEQDAAEAETDRHGDKEWHALRE